LNFILEGEITVANVLFPFFWTVELNLDYVVDNPWIVIPCSALKTININEIVQWLIKQASAPKKK
jgi:hypothetical protein